MVAVTSLWLPIVLAAVAVFIASSIVHMLLPHHRTDYTKLPNEDDLLEAMRQAGVGEGNYFFPHGTAKDMGSDEMKAKWARGPAGFMNVLPPGPYAMGKQLVQWLVYCLVLGVFVAYITGLALAPGVPYLRVFQVAGATAFLGYGLGAVVDSIWKGQRWSTSGKFLLDGLGYALLTAGVFGWLWPDA